MSRIDTIKAVDAEVREALVYAEDRPVLGFPDDWKLPARSKADGLGDCEDFMMLAARKLLDRGVPAGEMYFTLCHTQGRDGFDHAFLAVETPEGLWTCADTIAFAADPLPWSESELRQWARVSDPTDWRTWE